MRDCITADQLMTMCKENWPATANPIHRFAVYLNRLSTLGYQRAHKVMRDNRLSSGEFDVLATLRRSPPPHLLTPTDLQRSTLITSGGLTKLLYQLELEGLIERSVQKTDKRSKLVHLTNKGKQLIESAMADLLASEGSWLNTALNKDELDQLNELMGKALIVLEASSKP